MKQSITAPVSFWSQNPAVPTWTSGRLELSGILGKKVIPVGCIIQNLLCPTPSLLIHKKMSAGLDYSDLVAYV